MGVDTWHHEGKLGCMSDAIRHYRKKPMSILEERSHSQVRIREATRRRIDHVAERRRWTLAETVEQMSQLWLMTQPDDDPIRRPVQSRDQVDSIKAIDPDDHRFPLSAPT
jgi:hypothetical protein